MPYLICNLAGELVVTLMIELDFETSLKEIFSICRLASGVGVGVGVEVAFGDGVEVAAGAEVGVGVVYSLHFPGKA